MFGFPPVPRHIHINTNVLFTARQSALSKEILRMSKSYKYFTIPFESVPKDQALPYTAWFSSWSTTPVIGEPGMPPPVVIGVTENALLPAGAVELGTGSKDPPPPPPSLSAGGLTEYQASIINWLTGPRSADE
jgi:hypothetical protein